MLTYTPFSSFSICPFIFRLLKAAASALVPGSIDFIETVQDIRLDHLNAAHQYISDPDILKRVQEEVNQDCDRLKSFLEAAQVTQNMLARWLKMCTTDNSTLPNFAILIPSLFFFHTSFDRSLKRSHQDQRTSSWQLARDYPAESWLAY